MIQIANNVYYVGVNDRNKEYFEGLWPLPNGVTYNSYLINDDKVCLIDGVELDFFTQFIENIKEVLGDKPIDYLVVNHMEPDHSGSTELLKKYYPDIKVVGNKKTFDMMSGFYGVKENTVEVKNGTVLDLGHHQLKFFMTPMVHWPETMMTLDITNHILFSGDGFGCFGALNGGVIDTEFDIEWAWQEMVRYYSNIVGKYGTPVQGALKKLTNEQIDYICSTHGPVWHEYVKEVIAKYDKLSKYETNEGIVICYGSMYGNTLRAAETIARAATEAGIRNICMYDVSRVNHSFILRDIFRYRAVIVGAPTYNNTLLHDMEKLLSELNNRDIKKHYIGYFGSYAWASKAVSIMGDTITNELKWETVGTPVEIKQAPNADVMKQCQALGKAMAERLIADRA